MKERDTDAALVRRVMEKLGATERGMAAILDVTQPTVNGFLNGTQFLKQPVRKFLQGVLVEQAAARRIAGSSSVIATQACRRAARDPDEFVEHARSCVACILRSFTALADT